MPPPSTMTSADFGRSWLLVTRPTGGDIDGSLELVEEAVSLERETFSRIRQSPSSACRKLDGFGGIFQIYRHFKRILLRERRYNRSEGIVVRGISRAYSSARPACMRGSSRNAFGGRGDSHGKIEVDPTG